MRWADAAKIFPAANSTRAGFIVHHARRWWAWRITAASSGDSCGCVGSFSFGLAIEKSKSSNHDKLEQEDNAQLKCLLSFFFFRVDQFCFGVSQKQSHIACSQVSNMTYLELV